MITVESFFSSTLTTVDNVIGNFVHIAYTNFIQGHAGVITLLFTLYVIYLGYQFIYQPHHFNISLVMRHLITMLVVYGLVMNWQLYHLFIYKIFTIEPGNIAETLVKTNGTFQGESITKALDSIYEVIINTSMHFFGEVNFSSAGITFLFYGLLVLVIGMLMCVFALLLFIYTKMMMAIVLALGPIFILFLLWNATNGLFTAWLRSLITLALIPVVTSAVLVLMLSVIHVTLPDINQPIDNLQFYGIAPFLALSLTTTFLLMQVFRICGSLGGGLTPSNISLVPSKVRRPLS